MIEIIPQAELTRAAIMWAKLTTMGAFLLVLAFVFVMGFLWAGKLPRGFTRRGRLALTIGLGFAVSFLFVNSLRSCVRMEGAPSTITARDMP